MKNLPRSSADNRHERSTNQIQHQIALKTFGSTRIDLTLSAFTMLRQRKTERS